MGRRWSFQVVGTWVVAGKCLLKERQTQQITWAYLSCSGLQGTRGTGGKG